MNKSMITIDILQQVFRKKGYKFFTAGDYNINLFGIRAYPGIPNAFDDLIGCAYKVDGNWKIDLYDATTDPGRYYLQSPMRDEGTAVLAEGQHRGAFKIGMHQGKYEAYVQASKLPLHRDNNKDGKADTEGVQIIEELAGINLHRASENGTSVIIGKWSAGCQVIANSDDFKKLLAVGKKAAKYGSTFTYTLLSQKDFYDMYK